MYAKTMTDELTQIEGSYQNVAANGDEKDWNADANRWTKGDNDRLYVDGTKFVDYVALDSLVVITQGSGVDATAEINGDTLTLTVTRDDGINHKEMTAVFQLPDDLAEETDDEDDEDDDESEEQEDSEELVADGGEDRTSHVDDETIEAAIESNDDPDHPDAITVEEVRELLACIQRGAEEGFDTYMDVEDGNSDTTVVAEDRDTIVLTTGSNNSVAEELDFAYEGDIEITRVAKSVVTQIHHSLANERCGRSWSTDYPFVIAKPDGFDEGQRYVEAVVNSLQTRGLSPGQAWAYYGVEIRGDSRNMWGHRKGDHDHKNVSDALEKAKGKLPV